ncbi:MAG: lysine--tRNA ligase [Candidatus Woesearchaeota archaeon]
MLIDEKELKGLNDIEKGLEKEHHLIAERIKKLNALKEYGINPYPYRFNQTHHSKELHEKFAHLKAEEQTTENVNIAGRIVAFRRLGKATFSQVLDNDGKIQVLFNENDTKNYDQLKLLDMGDYIGVQGLVVKTKTGELTIKCSEYSILSKSLRPLPEKYHGIQDIEIKYRQRYLDLIMDENSKKVFVLRTKILTAIREFLNSRGFMEVETPTLETIYGGAAAKPFITYHNELDMKLYLRISLELPLKKLIAGGFEKVYQVGKVFRNESIDTTHNPEFTMMECYWAYADYHDMMELVEECYNYVALKVLGTTTIKYQDKVIELKRPWKRLTMKEALNEYANIDVESMDDNDIKGLLDEHKIEYRDDMTKGLLINQLFKIVEEKLIQPVFITDHPKETTPLCKLHRKHHDLIERFEPYINGWEIGNAYSELTDPIRQRYLLEEQAKELRAGLEESNPMDEEFCKAVDYGMPPMSGLGLGIDRMIMLLTDSASIRDIIFFPTMKIYDDKLGK